MAERSDEISPNVPDPTSWNLVVDDSDNNNDVYRPPEAAELGIAFYSVTSEYMEEMSRAHGIHFAGRDLSWSNLPVFSVPPKGYKSLEFNACSEEADLVADFIQEFQGQFARRRLGFGVGPPRTRALFRDAYGAATLAIYDSHFPWLVSINIADKARRIAALEYLSYRTAPKLWPDLYSGSFQPRKVKELEEQSSRVAAELRNRLAELDEQIDAERAFYAPYFNLTVLGDDDLKKLVRRAFEDVFGFTVTDLDELVPEGERKTLDLRLEQGAWSAFVEVRGSGTRNARRTDLERLEEHYGEAKVRYGAGTTKILLFNGMYARDHQERSRRPVFDRVTAEEAEDSGICLVTAQQLLHCIEAYRNSELTVEALTAALSREGLFALPS